MSATCTHAKIRASAGPHGEIQRRDKAEPANTDAYRRLERRHRSRRTVNIACSSLSAGLARALEGGVGRPSGMRGCVPVERDQIALAGDLPVLHLPPTAADAR